jgi:hypothetical protein
VLGDKFENALLELPIEERGSPVKLDRTKHTQEEEYKWGEGPEQGEGEERRGKLCRMKALRDKRRELELNIVKTDPDLHVDFSE